jgi:hypothetical protein
MRLTKRRSLADSPTRNGGLPRLRANLQSERGRSEAKKRFACDLVSSVLSRCFHRALSLLSPHRHSFHCSKVPTSEMAVSLGRLSPLEAEGPGFFYTVAYFIVAPHKIRHMKNNVHVFHFFCFLFFLRVPHDDIFNMTTKI